MAKRGRLDGGSNERDTKAAAKQTKPAEYRMASRAEMQQ